MLNKDQKIGICIIITILGYLLYGIFGDHNPDIKINIADRTFLIPQKYISKNPEGWDTDSQLLEFMLPDFTASYIGSGSIKDRSRVLIADESTKADLDDLHEIRRERAPKIEYLKSKYGLESELWYNNKKGEIIPYNEVHIKKDSKGSIVNYITCSTLKRGTHIKFPSCRSVFFKDGLYYSLTFNKEKYLSKWDEFNQKTVTFLESFEVTKEDYDNASK